MKLSKVYTNNNKFKPIHFSKGINVIFGDVEDKKESGIGQSHEHNIGKTSLAHVIDFLLLKGVKKDSFFEKNKEKFSDWVFFLEIELNNGEYLTIRRPINPNSKISFKKHFSKNQNYSYEKLWDYEDLSITAKTRSPITILEEYLSFNVNEKYGYRFFLTYLLRTQNDYRDVFKLDKFYKDSEWKPALFDLLGFDSVLLERKYELDVSTSEDKKVIDKIQSELDNAEVYKIRAAIEAKLIEREEIKKKIDVFDFYQKEENATYDLVKNVESEISLLNSERYSLEYELDLIRKSLDSSNLSSLNIQEIEHLFNEINIYFPKNLSKEYEDVLNFSSQISKERKKYLKEELVDVTEKIQKIKIDLSALNSRRMDILSVLKEKDTFSKYKKYQDDLIGIESEIAKFQIALNGAKTVDRYQNSLDQTRDLIKVLSTEIKKNIDSGSQNFQEIKKIFQNIYKSVMEYTALLIVEPNKKGNVVFDTSIITHSQDLTSKADGYTSTKVLSASFVIAILAHYSSRSFFRFAYHDGILESLGDTPKINFINLMRNICEEHGLQYIFSVIKSDVPDGFRFEEEEIKRILSKKDQLFGLEF